MQGETQAFKVTLHMVLALPGSFHSPVSEIAEAMDILGNICFSKNIFVDNRNYEDNVGINRY